MKSVLMAWGYEHDVNGIIDWIGSAGHEAVFPLPGLWRTELFGGSCKTTVENVERLGDKRPM